MYSQCCALKQTKSNINANIRTNDRVLLSRAHHYITNKSRIYSILCTLRTIFALCYIHILRTQWASQMIWVQNRAQTIRRHRIRIRCTRFLYDVCCLQCQNPVLIDDSVGITSNRMTMPEKSIAWNAGMLLGQSICFIFETK